MTESVNDGERGESGWTGMVRFGPILTARHIILFKKKKKKGRQDIDSQIILIDHLSISTCPGVPERPVNGSVR